ncbi:CTP synthase [Rickettsia endosymbiont of Cardiosporidium cionae]|uniref:CTP synthase n=1 Tax=Rickettsia endosymbiont of Cardiosporidium cionae TaxID=2777155 RepID=UPI001893F7DF|nr:CTP synthase [Rickettsia endosymbiont of Cardiosporidium cionae]KAF8818697.1 CTP synthetase [Rickettsia endosymbiont of Cardiosporidium cionae]
MSKYIFITGGVTSSLGKGIVAASLGKLLQSSGYKVAIQKFDPYINVDPGTLNPYEHGECYVTDDGMETDLDLGHYERFLDITTSYANNTTGGSIYQNVIAKERKGIYLGKTVQVVPHIIDEIKEYFKLLSNDTDDNHIIIVEIGGTVGDIESLPFIEAVRQFRLELTSKNLLNIHLTLLPYLGSTKELKTKPTQHSVKTLLSYGIQPDIVVCRASQCISLELRKKIALFCNLNIEDVIEAIDTECIYKVPILLLKENLNYIILKKFNFCNITEPDLRQWNYFIQKLENPKYDVKLGIIGKYVELSDAYISLRESLIHASAYTGCKINIQYLDSSLCEEDAYLDNALSRLDGILVASGFGYRGIEGKINAIKFARVNNIPFFGICLGMQCAIIEYSRNVIKLADSHSTEFFPDVKTPVIDIIENTTNIQSLKSNMRLGAYNCEIFADTRSALCYKKDLVYERHRHKYEFNNRYLKLYKEYGMVFAGMNTENNIVEIIEIRDHPWFVATQFHPELKSTVLNPHPLFLGFTDAMIQHKMLHI